MSILELKKVNKIYPNGFHALKDIDLSVDSGDIMGIIGYSGAGKSTLIRLLNRLEEPSSGEIYFNNKNLLALKEKDLQLTRQKIGMIFQHFNLFSSRNVFSNIAFSLEVAGWKKQQIEKRVMELLEIVGLTHLKNAYPKQLSGGQKQRVAIARALANNPTLLLSDEATSALDSKTTNSILELLKNIQKDLNLTIVLITHQIEVIQKICNKVCVISNGEIIERGSSIEVLSNPKHELTKELLMHSPFAKELMLEHKNAYKITFVGEHINEPLITQVAREFNIDLNILCAEIEPVVKTKLGYIIVEFLSQDSSLKDLVIKKLESKGLKIEKLHNKSE